MDVGTQGTTQCEFLGFSFGLICPKVEAKEAGNLEISSSTEKRNPNKSLLSVIKGLGTQAVVMGHPLLSLLGGIRGDLVEIQDSQQDPAK